MGMGVEINEIPGIMSFVTCPSCGKEIQIIDLGEEVWLRKRLHCPYCGTDLGVDGHHALEEKFASKAVNCPGCGTPLELTVSSFPHNNTEQYCPLCSVAAC